MGSSRIVCVRCEISPESHCQQGGPTHIPRCALGELFHAEAICVTTLTFWLPQNLPVPDWELSSSCPGPPAWGWIVHGIWTEEGYLALLPSPTHLGCSKTDDDVPEGKPMDYPTATECTQCWAPPSYTELLPSPILPSVPTRLG